MAMTQTSAPSPAQFVRYAPELDVLSAHFEEDLETVVAGVEQYVVNSVAGEGVGRAVRFAHAKGYGLVRAEVEILDGLPPGYAQGIYSTPGRHDALIRFSNGVAHLGADATLSNAFGLALKIFNIGGTTLLDDEPDAGTFDYNTINMPVFFCNTVSHYLFIQQLFTDAPRYFAKGRTGAHQFLAEYLTGKGTLAEKDWAWEELLAFLGLIRLPAQNVLLAHYWTMGAVRHGDFIAKVRFAPVPAFADAIERRVCRSDVRSRRLPHCAGGGAEAAALRVRPAGPALHESRANAHPGRDRRMAGGALAFRHRGQGTFTGAGHLRCGQPRKNGRVVLYSLAGHGGACATRRDHASTKRSVPALVDRTPSAQPSGAAGAAKRARSARRATSHLTPKFT